MPEHTIAVAMSGGVDSSVAAALLAERHRPGVASQGRDTIGVTMRLATDNSADAAAAEAVCRAIGIPHHVVDVRDEFRRSVVEHFVAEYRAGRTPNPCVRCNRTIKWGVFAAKARELGAEWVATGHYARIERVHDGTVRLLRGLDGTKDQSYALWSLPQDALQRTSFPLGAMTKTEVRTLALEQALPTARMSESQDVCFVPGEDYGAFLVEWMNEHGIASEALRPGPILDREGRHVGTHPGTAFITIGQRKGLGIALGRPVYVTRIDAPSRTVWVGEDEDLLTKGLQASDANWIAGEPPMSGAIVSARIRYLSHPAPARVYPSADREGFRLEFDEPQRAVTPGQSAVLYDGDVVLGGGVIAAAGS